MGYAYEMNGHHCSSACEEPHLDEHLDACECGLCHENHEIDGMHITDGVLDCCTQHINLLVERKKFCPAHRMPFIDKEDTQCAKCERIEFIRTCWAHRIITGAGAMALIVEVEGGL